MTLCEAVEMLKKGLAVTRMAWMGSVFFKMHHGEMRAYHITTTRFNCPEYMIFTHNWIVNDSLPNMSFCEIIPYLEQGLRIKMAGWDMQEIYLNESHEFILIHTAEQLDYQLDFKTLKATDWVIYEQ
jgi:hypothetical protein